MRKHCLANRFLDWDPKISFAELRAIVPLAEKDTVDCVQDLADQLCQRVKALLLGKAVNMSELELLESRRVARGKECSITATQVAPASAEAAVDAATSTSTAAGSRSALTQVLPPSGSEGADEEGSRKRLRAEPDLSKEDFSADRDLKTRIIMSALKSKNAKYEASKNRGTFQNSATPEVLEKSMRTVFRFLGACGLGLESKTAFAINLMSPPEEHIPQVMSELQKKLEIAATVAPKLQSLMVERPKNRKFNMDEFMRVTAFVEKSAEEAE